MAALSHLSRPPRARFGELYRHEFAFVNRAARRFGVPEAVLDDAVQDVFLTAYRRIDELDFAVTPRAWLYTVTRRVAFRYRRSAARRARKLAALPSASAPADEPWAHARDERVAIERALAGLGTKLRDVFVMSELLEMTAPEIASELQLPINTVYSRVRLARQKLEAMQVGVDGLVAAGRRVGADDRKRAHRIWVALAPMLARNPIPAMVGTAWIRFGWAAAAGLAVAIVGGSATSKPRAIEAIHPELVAAAGRIEPVRAAPIATPAVVDSPIPVVDPQVPANLDVEVERTVPKVASTPTDTLPAEVALLDRAHAALAGQTYPVALALLDEHVRTYPDSSLADLRAAARIRALCGAGNLAQGRAEARLLLRARPGSPAAAGAARACDGSEGFGETRRRHG